MDSATIPGVPDELCKEFDENLTAAGPLSYEAQRAVDRAKDQFIRGRQAYTPKTQPRDTKGQFRQILARLRYDLGDTELENITNEIKQAERLADTGDIQKATEAGKNVVQLVDEIKDGVLDSNSIQNIRDGARELGKVMAYLPIPQGDQSEKVRFSDIPAATRTLIKEMIQKVEDKIGNDDAAEPTSVLKNFMAGGVTMSADDMSSQLNVLLRLLT